MKNDHASTQHAHRIAGKSPGNQLASEAVTQRMQAVAPPPFQLKVNEPNTSDIEEQTSQEKISAPTQFHQFAAPPSGETPPGDSLKPVQFHREEEATGSESGLEKPTVNNTGMPDKLKAGLERLSGFSMDDVKVHFNSAEPAKLQAHAYAQGTQIHIGPGQERYLPHEAWHVVQQKQGRVKATRQLDGGVDVNDDDGLEREADVMGGKALLGNKMTGCEFNSSTQLNPLSPNSRNEILQGVFLDQLTMLGDNFEIWHTATNDHLAWLVSRERMLRNFAINPNSAAVGENVSEGIRQQMTDNLNEWEQDEDALMPDIGWDTFPITVPNYMRVSMLGPNSNSFLEGQHNFQLDYFGETGVMIGVEWQPVPDDEANRKVATINHLDGLANGAGELIYRNIERIPIEQNEPEEMEQENVQDNNV